MQHRVPIPHEPPMHWLDSASLSDDGLAATASATITPEHPFLRDGQLLRSALIELMAQGAAAGSALKAARQNKKVRTGMLVALSDCRITAGAPVGATVHLTAVHERSFGPLSMARLEARINNQLIASARMTFHLHFE